MATVQQQSVRPVSGLKFFPLHLLAILLLLLAPLAEAAKPTSTTQAASGSAPEIYRSNIDYANRVLTLQGIHLITGSYSSPDYPTTVTIGGRSVAIDEAASRDGTDFATNRGPLLIPFDNILTALSNLVTDGSLPPEVNFVVTVITGGGSVAFSTYFAQAVTEVSSPPQPPSTGSCPCSAYFDQYYNALYALLWPNCTAPGSSNSSVIVPTEQYIEASYIDELMVRYIIISSDSSLSPRNSGSSNYVSSCSVRTDYGAFLAGPEPVSDEDHAACVEDIIAREPICRGGNWLDP